MLSTYSGPHAVMARGFTHSVGTYSHSHRINTLPSVQPNHSISKPCTHTFQYVASVFRPPNRRNTTMFTFKVCFLLVAVVVVAHNALPSPIVGDAVASPLAVDELPAVFGDVEALGESGHWRSKRATCDLASAANIGHTACAAHCILRGFKGGWCSNKAVCNCRRWMARRALLFCCVLIL